jgi:hypothetical protein
VVRIKWFEILYDILWVRFVIRWHEGKKRALYFLREKGGLSRDVIFNLILPEFGGLKKMKPYLGRIILLNIERLLVIIYVCDE